MNCQSQFKRYTVHAHCKSHVCVVFLMGYMPCRKGFILYSTLDLSHISIMAILCVGTKPGYYILPTVSQPLVQYMTYLK